VFPADNDAQKAIDKDNKIPIVPLREKNMPKKPSISIGNNEYPRVLITL
jgi:hypothetical protein